MNLKIKGDDSMHTDKELLKLAGKLALACEQILISHVLNLSDRLEYMQECLNEYNNAIIETTMERNNQNHDSMFKNLAENVVGEKE
jgi:hypothetical protein